MYAGRPVPDLIPTPLPQDPVRLLCLGRVVADKGFDLALSALSLLAERYPQIRLTIAGDGPARSDLEHQAAKLGLAHAVEFPGWVDPSRVPELINESTVVVIPSRWFQEGLPVVSMEAAQMARPIVATRVGGLPEAVVDQVTGLLVEREDHETLAEAIAYLVEHPEVSERMGQAGRQRARDLFSLERYVDEFEALYQRLGREQGPSGYGGYGG
jgi:glycogen(starch) synthase